MKVAVHGSKSFNDYNIFLRAMRVALFDLEKSGDKEFVIYSAGPNSINAFSMEFINITENSLKALGVSTKVIKLPPKVIKGIMHEMDYMAYFSLPKEPTSDLVREAEDKDIEVGVFRY